MTEETRQCVEVPPEQLRVTIDPDSLGFEDTRECKYNKGTIGQGRAIRALQMGLEIKSPGYNIYAAGLAGTGKKSTIKNLLVQLNLGRDIPPDICYVNNFKDNDMPMVMMLPAGMGKQFQQDVDEMIVNLSRRIPHLFESEAFKKKSEQIVEHYLAKQKELVKIFNEKIQKERFQLVQFQIGPYTRQDVAPIYDGKPVPVEQLESLAEDGKFDREELKRIRVQLRDLRIELDGIMRETRNIEKEIRNRINALERETGLPVVGDLISDIRLRYQDHDEKIQHYLNDMQEHILSNLKTFKEKEQEKQPETHAAVLFQAPLVTRKFLEYKVNVLVDNSQTRQPPVIIETAPTYKNLFGTIEREADRFGYWRTDFTRIKAGSFLRANGGYIVFDALEALIEPGVWTFLKRTLQNRLLTMHPYDPLNIVSTAMKPESIPIDVKVIMIGDNRLYSLLYALEEVFPKIFKVKAQFDTEMPYNDNHVRDYVLFLKRIIQEENLLQFYKTAVSAVIEYGIRLSGSKKKLTTRFSDIANLVREANYWAQKAGSDYVLEEHVEKAYEERLGRLNLVEEKIREMIADGMIMIDLTDRSIGQVNGLSVYHMGDYVFGIPTKITAQASMGKNGVINIEREAKLSGKAHDKGVLILEGYFRGKYAQEKPLTVSASICFEQSYAGVDGDSASSAELYALLSSLAKLPVRQDLAVTGSVNQKGEIQPVGGINEKIEGFFDVCRIRGFSEEQGVVIPALNVPELMLRKDVVQAVSEGKFHIYPVRTIDEGIALLTGVDAGVASVQGLFPPHTVNCLVDEALKVFAQGMKSFTEEKNEGSKENAD